ncbi:MAG TPA: hypothetical protein VH164_00745 [Ktedonobacteraceae bacterium]|nr:hypothetical protein [Ktedonobacteraceae bacterium]
MGKPHIQRLPQLLQGGQACLEKPFDQTIAREPNGGKRTNLLQPYQTAPVCK